MRAAKGGGTPLATETAPARPGGPPAGDSVEVEAAVMAALDHGDRARALTLLMDAYGRPVYRYCRQMMGDADLASDVHQTTFVSAYEALPTFERRSSLQTWLYGIARHRCLDALRSKRRRERRVELRAELPDAPAAGSHPADRLAVERGSRALERCLESLPPAVRTAVVLRFQEGLSYEDIGRTCGERPATLRVRVCRALRRLRACLQGQGVMP